MAESCLSAVDSAIIAKTLSRMRGGKCKRFIVEYRLESLLLEAAFSLTYLIRILAHSFDIVKSRSIF
jgi:hypothetical protein